MQDSEYLFVTDFIKEFQEAGLYVKVSAGQRDSTFTVKMVGREREGSVELTEHVYSFIPVKGERMAHFNFRRWAAQTEIKKNLKFTVYSIAVIG